MKVASLNNRLSKQDFIDLAFDIMAETGGYDAITIDKLCKHLNVSKGSFYWHFKGRNELIDAVVEAWAGQIHKGIHSAIEQQTDGEPLQAIGGIIQYWRDSNIAEIDQVMRHWGRHDPRVADAVSKADRLLLAFLQKNFHSMGFDEVEALRRARLMIAIGIAQPLLEHLPNAASKEADVKWMMAKLFS